MDVYSSSLWIKDIENEAKDLTVLNELAGSTVLITGSTGLICSAIVDLLAWYNRSHDANINVLAAGRDTEKIKTRFRAFCNEKWFQAVEYDATSEKNDFSFECDYIIHGASNASPSKIVEQPVETMLSNFSGTKYLLDYSYAKNVKRFLFISSSEVYGNKSTNEPFCEDEYGYIDLLNPRNSYSVGKRAAETLCASYASEYNVDYVIVRPGHIYGPTASQTDSRVSSAWAYDVANGIDIIMKSDGSQLRSYCYCLDCASAIITVLVKGQSGEAYNISNPNSVISIREMAEIMTQYAGVELRMELPTAEEKKGFNPMINSSLNSNKLAGLGWFGVFDAKTGFAHTIDILKECSKK